MMKKTARLIVFALLCTTASVSLTGCGVFYLRGYVPKEAGPNMPPAQKEQPPAPQKESNFLDRILNDMDLYSPPPEKKVPPPKAPEKDPLDWIK